ncbi:MAG: VTT domain-containing protein [Planctomycetes bacterium]|nr:VTT domain-containing protein [Planctomycetota bacterium]
MKSPSARSASFVRWASLGAFLLGVVLLARSVPLDRALGALDVVVRDAGPWGPVVFAGGYALAALLLLPGSVLTLAAGALFGPLLGTAVVSLASTTAAALAFLIARHAARDAVAAVARRRRAFGAIDRAVGEGGWKVVALLRLSPLVPFSLGNYLFGLTRVGFVGYVLASWVAMLPGTFLYVYLGHLGRAGLAAAAGAERARSPAEWALLAAGLVATVAVTVLITRRARAALAEKTEGPVTEDDVARPADEGRRPWRTWSLAAAGFATLAAGLLASCGVVGRWFGPPQVSMEDVYAGEAGTATFDHGLLDGLLAAHVDAETLLVDYQGLRRDAATLDRYLERLAAADLGPLGRDERLALLLNAYNAFTLRLILDHYPVESIRDIPEDRRWKGRTWTLAGQPYTLDELEHEQIRPKFREPRIHFAVNCASIGCPPLRREAYVGARLEEQLEEQTRLVHADPRWFRYDPDRGELHLTRLYDWFEGDFSQVAGSALDFAARYSPALRRDLERGQRPRVRWLEYDWALNEQRRSGS